MYDFSPFFCRTIDFEKMGCGSSPMSCSRGVVAGRASWARCGIVANAVIAFAVTVASCDAQSAPPGSASQDGSIGGSTGGTGGEAGAAGGGSNGSTISCNPTGNGCLCIVDDSQPGQLDGCSPASVAQGATEKGVCCTAESLCSCIRYTCRSDPSSSFCQCGSVATLASVTLGSPAAECPAPTAAQKCCFSQDNASCICSLLACTAEEVAVPGCSATVAGACNAGEAIEKCR
jgi:hypothetical protein